MKTNLTRTYHLNIGEVIVCPESAVISTVLGSCVSVCLYSKKSRVGGMIHYAHSKKRAEYGQAKDFRYAEVAIPALVSEMKRVTGENEQDFVAKVVGGASEIDGARISYDIGPENIKAAKDILSEYEIRIVGEDTGGSQGRKVLFHTENNRLRVASINSKEDRSDRSDGVAPSVILGIRPKEPFSLSLQQALPKKRKVLIVDDSKVIRDLIKRVLSEDPDFEIVGSAGNAVEADQLLKKMKPDVITLDIHMPGITGVEWLETLLPKDPIPVVMISSLQLQEGNEVFRALELGAVDYIQKPSLQELPAVGPAIREKVKEASFAKVIIRPRNGTKSVAPAGLEDLDLKRVLAIGASTGGTEALKVVMTMLPEKIPPTVIVQHIPPVFSKAFADRLNQICPFEVKEAEDGDELRVSRVLIAPGGKQMKVLRDAKGLFVRVTDDAPMNRHKPSVDFLFHSIASVVGKNSVGVILTGMGGDGARGLLEMRKKGSKTIAQDEASSVVYGMPKVALEAGAVDKVAPLESIAKEILIALSAKKAA